MIEQVKCSLDFDNEGSVTINSDDLNLGSGHRSGSFELYPPKKICINLFSLIKQVAEMACTMGNESKRTLN